MKISKSNNYLFQLNKPSKSPSVHFGASPTFYGSSAASGTSGTYLPYGTPSIQTYFQPTSQPSNNVSSQLHHSSSQQQNTSTNQNFLALNSTPRNNQSISGGVLQPSSKFSNATSTSSSASPGALFTSKKYNKGSLTSSVDSTSATGGSTAAQRALSPSYEEDTVSETYDFCRFSFGASV